MLTLTFATVLQVLTFALFQQMNFKINWDTLGIATSLACAIHCALLPLIFTSLPILGINVIDNIAFEIVMVVLAFAIGLYSLYHGYKKHHHQVLPIIIFTAGIIFLVLKLFFAEYETWLLIPAIAGIISAHFINYRSCTGLKLEGENGSTQKTARCKHVVKNDW